MTRPRTVPDNGVAMVTYDVECPVAFAADVAPDQQVLFRKGAGGRPGWIAAVPVVRWNGPRDALVLLVLREPEGSAIEGVCAKALTKVREWLTKAGLAPESGAAPDVQCVAIPRG